MDDFLRVRFTCRGYQDDIAVTRDVVKSEIKVKLQRYMGDMVKDLQSK
ncbi:hypothetical protein [Paenibacillus sp. FJAT-26967]|nr:hypothetical protein [Paenibacillus sp. FJAT-26967]